MANIGTVDDIHNLIAYKTYSAKWIELRYAGCSQISQRCSLQPAELAVTDGQELLCREVLRDGPIKGDDHHARGVACIT